MTKIKVKSSNITSIDYNEKEQILIIEFIGGGKYIYNKLPKDIYNSFIKAESKGKFFFKNIKGKFEFKKIKKIEKEKEKENGRDHQKSDIS